VERWLARIFRMVTKAMIAGAHIPNLLCTLLHDFARDFEVTLAPESESTLTWWSVLLERREGVFPCPR
jgi:hypothetical protein